MSKKLKELQDDFLNFKTKIPLLLNSLNELIGSNLSYEYNDIDKVEEFYEKNHSNPIKIGLSIEELNEMFYAFIGEAFIHYNGGNWILSDSKKDRAFGTPIITGARNTKYTISPYVWKEFIVRDLDREPISKIIKRSQIPRNV